jgi:hypothetical protein
MLLFFKLQWRGTGQRQLFIAAGTLHQCHGGKGVGAAAAAGGGGADVQKPMKTRSDPQIVRHIFEVVCAKQRETPGEAQLAQRLQALHKKLRRECGVCHLDAKYPCFLPQKRARA